MNFWTDVLGGVKSALSSKPKGDKNVQNEDKRVSVQTQKWMNEQHLVNQRYATDIYNITSLPCCQEEISLTAKKCWDLEHIGHS